MFKKFRKNLLQLVLTIFLLYFLVLVFLYFYQRNLLYHPNENNYSGDEILVDIKKVKIQTEDNIELLGWYHEKNMILYGESLGTGIATHLAQNKNYAGVILETPFTSMVDAAKSFYPYIPVNLLLKDKFENDKKIKNINSPIMVMHGEIDQIVPFSMGKKIYAIANEPKYSYFTKYDDHMMEFDKKLVLALQSFIKSLN